MSLSQEDIKYLVALGKIPGVGGVLTRFLISYAGSAQQVFKMPIGKLLKVPKVGEKIAKAIHHSDNIKAAEEELIWCEKEGIRLLTYLDSDYPQRLTRCHDAPVLLFLKGKSTLNPTRCVSIIGTRHASDYGKSVTEQIVEGLAPYGVTIISGLALGIDIAAHKAALKFNQPTFAVLGHGLDTIYPWQNKSIAEKMLAEGGLISEYPSNTKPDRNNFPQRNRIVAGMSDATIVVESAISGGAMITAEMAFSYNRDLFAIPGRWQEEYAQGCLKLIKENKAQLITSAEDIAISLGWKREVNTESTLEKIAVQRSLFENLDENEKMIASVMIKGKAIELDKLHYLCNLPLSTLSSTLLSLEFKGLVRSHPGKQFSLI